MFSRTKEEEIKIENSILILNQQGRLIEFSTLIIHREPTLPTNRIDLTRISYRIGRVKYRRGIQFTNKSRHYLVSTRTFSPFKLGYRLIHKLG